MSPGRGIALVSVQTEIGRAGRFPDHHHVYFAQGVRMGGLGLETKVSGRFEIIFAFRPAVSRKAHIVEYIGRKYVVHDLYPPHQAKRNGNHSDNACDCEFGQAEFPGQFFFQPDRPYPYRQGRNVKHTDSQDSRHQFAQQFPYFAGIGGKQIEEHIRGDDRPAKQIQEHELERAQHIEPHQYPGRSARAAAYRHQCHVKGQWER